MWPVSGRPGVSSTARRRQLVPSCEPRGARRSDRGGRPKSRLLARDPSLADRGDGLQPDPGTRPQTPAYALTGSPTGSRPGSPRSSTCGPTTRAGDRPRLAADEHHALLGHRSYQLVVLAVPRGAARAVAGPPHALEPTDGVRVVPARDPPPAALVRRTGLQHPTMDADATRRTFRGTGGSRRAGGGRDDVLPARCGAAERCLAPCRLTSVRLLLRSGCGRPRRGAGDDCCGRSASAGPGVRVATAPGRNESPGRRCFA